jgi:predicted 3-demethylubiquinone-9 3-methyltransferase (glyoxalase superfamily)
MAWKFRDPCPAWRDQDDNRISAFRFLGISAFVRSMQRITPFLWFDGQAEEAAKFYVSVFKNSKIKQITHYTGEELPERKGQVMTVSFELDGEEFVALNGGPQFKFTEAVSFVINCDTQEEIDYYWEKLTADGGSEVQCGWLADKYGLSWQVVPGKFFAEWVKDPAGLERVMHEVMQMTKLDLAKLTKAFEGKRRVTCDELRTTRIAKCECGAEAPHP